MIVGLQVSFFTISLLATSPKNDGNWSGVLLSQNGTMNWDLPSGKRLHTYGKSAFSMGKSTISMCHSQ